MHFYKFHGNGNDFIVLDNRNGKVELSNDQIQTMCNRRFGVGADGLMFINNSKVSDFEMKYYNSDGNISSMCGNGGRCIAALAFHLGIVGKEMEFLAFDGLHKAKITSINTNNSEWGVNLELMDVNNIDKNEGYYFLDTGSPHYVEFVDKVAEINVDTEGSKTRYSEKFAPEGTNVNFVERGEDRIFVRTYERGVEQETLSCGTGVTASAIASFLESGKSDVVVHTTGGDFNVRFDHHRTELKDNFTNIWLQGPAIMVFEGEYNF